MIDEFLNSAQSEYDSLKAHCDFIERENRALKKEIEMCDKKIDKLRATRDKAIELLGNYKHYSIPDENQNSDNEDLVNNAFNILKEVE